MTQTLVIIWSRVVMKCIGTKCINALLSILINAFHLREYDNICVRNEQMTQWVASDMMSFPRRRPINTISIVAQRGISGTFLFSITVQHALRSWTPSQYRPHWNPFLFLQHPVENTHHHGNHCRVPCKGIHVVHEYTNCSVELAYMQRKTEICGAKMDIVVTHAGSRLKPPNAIVYVPHHRNHYRVQY